MHNIESIYIKKNVCLFFMHLVSVIVSVTKLGRMGVGVSGVRVGVGK